MRTWAPGQQAWSEVRRRGRGQVLELIDTGGSEGGAAGQHWVLDPIDGTRGFVGLRQYAICLGMLQEGRVLAALAPAPPLFPLPP